MGAVWKHFKTICKHKAIVFRECVACGIPWQGLTHDLSKFTYTEFISSIKFFQGNRSPIEAEKEERGFSLAWQHHMGHNPHHWEYWIDFGKQGEIIANKIPEKYIIEMICDYIGAGIVYNKENWTQSTPLDYFKKVRAGRHFHPDTEKVIVSLLEIIRDEGLESFHKKARTKNLYDTYLSKND